MLFWAWWRQQQQPGEPSASLLVEHWAKQTFAIHPFWQAGASLSHLIENLLSSRQWNLAVRGCAEGEMRPHTQSTGEICIFHFELSLELYLSGWSLVPLKMSDTRSQVGRVVWEIRPHQALLRRQKVISGVVWGIGPPTAVEPVCFKSSDKP